jgi:hypothetical protein
MGHNRIRGFFENTCCFAETAIPSRASGEEAVSAQGAGRSQSVFSQEPQRAPSHYNLPFSAVCDVTSPPVNGWCNYSI